MVHFKAFSIGLIGLCCFLLHPLMLLSTMSADSHGESYCIERDVCWTLGKSGSISRRTSKTILVKRQDVHKLSVINCKSNWTGSTLRIIKAEQGSSLKTMLPVRESAIKILPDNRVKGRLLLSIEFSQIKAGSYISWEIEEIYNGGMLPDHMGFAPSHLFTDSLLVERDRFEVVIPRDLKLSYVARRMGSHSVPKERKVGSCKSFCWNISNTLPRPELPLMPSLHQSVPTIRTSLATNWDLISQWMGGALSRNMEVTGNVRSLISSYRNDPLFESLNIFKKIEYVVKKVNSEVRYIDVPQTIFSDINGHTVDEILSKGYGDCVDRAIVLSTLLKALDISALPVFVGSRHYRPIEPELPSPYAGDHCIVKVSGSFGEFFIDPGAVSNRIGELPVTYQGVVAFSPLTGEFFKTPDSKGADNGIDSEHRILINRDGSFLGKFRVNVFGDNESLVRAYMDKETDISKLKSMVGKLLFLSNSAIVQDIVVADPHKGDVSPKGESDDESSGGLRISGSYISTIPSKIIGGRLAITLSGYKPGKECIESTRLFPIVYRAPVSHRSLIYLQCTDSDMKITRPAGINHSVGPVSYSFSSELIGEKVVLRSSYVRNSRQIMPEYYEMFKKLIDQRSGCESAPLIVKFEKKIVVIGKRVPSAKRISRVKAISETQQTGHSKLSVRPLSDQAIHLSSKSTLNEKSEIILSELSFLVEDSRSISVTQQEVLELDGRSSSKHHEIAVPLPPGARVLSYSGGTMNLKTRIVKDLLHHEVTGGRDSKTLKLHFPSTGGRERLKWHCKYTIAEKFTQNFFHRLTPVRGSLPVKKVSVELLGNKNLPLSLEYSGQGNDSLLSFKDEQSGIDRRVISVSDLRDPRSAIYIMRKCTWKKIANTLLASLKQLDPLSLEISRDSSFPAKAFVKSVNLNELWQRVLCAVEKTCSNKSITLSHLQKTWIMATILAKSGYAVSLNALRLAGSHATTDLPSSRGFEHGLVECNGQWFSPDLTSSSASQFAAYLYGGDLLMLTDFREPSKTYSLSTFKPRTRACDVRLVEDISATLSEEGVLSATVNRTVGGSLAVKLESLFQRVGSTEIERSMARRLQRHNKGVTVTDFSYSTCAGSDDLRISFNIKIPSSVVRLDDGLHAVTMPFVPVAGDANVSALSRRSVLRIPEGYHLKALPQASSEKDDVMFESIHKIDHRTVLWEQQWLPVRQVAMSASCGENRDFVAPVIEYVSFSE